MTTASETSVSAPIQEIFSSYQGEGIHVGKRQVFVRVAHCHLKCRYCDTPMHSSTGQCFVEADPASGKQTVYENPITIETLLPIIQALCQSAPHHSVSVTGGEPLLYHRFLARLFPHIQAFSKTYLETSGTQPDFLAAVIAHTDIVAMDIKLPSATGEPMDVSAHQAFYQLCADAPVERFIKLVVDTETTDEELQQVREIVTHPHCPVIVQPVTDLISREVHVPAQTLFRVANTLSRWYSDVRIIPQTHKMLKVL